MKRALATLLIVLMVFALAACGGKNNMGESDAKKLISEIYNANKISAIMENHESVLYSVFNKYEDEQVAGENYYIAAGCSYMETPLKAEYFFTDNKSYLCQVSTEGAISKYAFKAQLETTYSPYCYSVSPEFEINWYDENHETIKECYEKDGLIHIVTEYDSTGSQYFITDTLEQEYNDELITNEIIADTKSKEVVKIEKSIKGEGDTATVVYSVSATYGVKEPAAARNLRGYFEATTSNQVNLKLVLNPGTNKELTYNYTIPVNISVSYSVDNSSKSQVYTDYACTKPKTGSWDRMSDLERYIVTKE